MQVETKNVNVKIYFYIFFYLLTNINAIFAQLEHRDWRIFDFVQINIS